MRTILKFRFWTPSETACPLYNWCRSPTAGELLEKCIYFMCKIHWFRVQFTNFMFSTRYWGSISYFLGFGKYWRQSGYLWEVVIGYTFGRYCRIAGDTKYLTLTCRVLKKQTIVFRYIYIELGLGGGIPTLKSGVRKGFLCILSLVLTPIRNNRGMTLLEVTCASVNVCCIWCHLYG